MSGPAQSVRPPAVAGMFYPASEQQCSAMAQQLLSVNATASGGAWLGGIVPHAGWVYSGAIAGETIGTIARGTSPDVVVIFGAVHTPAPLEKAALASFDRWAVPGGMSESPRDLAEQVSGVSRLFITEDYFHQREHAIEVELPLVRQAWPDARLLPIEVPLVDHATAIGELTAQVLARAGLKAVYLASSDLTHYGPRFGLTAGGVGPGGQRWAMDNDRRLLALVEGYQTDAVVAEVKRRFNACGGGAIAAMLAACRAAGAKQAKLLRHANSAQVVAEMSREASDNVVGYAALVVG